ncbi:MAG TPA: carboxypeptidase-like regulatory domain-containing protein, partial [Pyrinomonadaceae bacterium]
MNQGTINLFKNSARLAQAMILGMFLVTTAFGQSGSLRGFVTDQHGAVVPGATVTARGPNEIIRTATTDQ